MRREKTLADLWGEVLAARRRVAAGITAGIVLAAGFVLTAMPYYRAQMMIAPVDAAHAATPFMQGERDFPALQYAAQQGMLQSPDFQRFENTLGGATVAAILLKDEKIKKGLSYDASFFFLRPHPADTNARHSPNFAKQNSRGIQTEKNWIALGSLRDPGDDKKQWTPEKLAEYIAGRVRAQPVGQSPMRRLVYLHPSREFGVYFLHRLHETVDGAIRKKAREEAQERIDYLRGAVEANANPDHRRALAALLLEQERILMLASIGQAYAAAVIEPPSASSRAHWPDALLVFPVFVFAGALIGFVSHGLKKTAPVSATQYFDRRRGWYDSRSVNSNEKPYFFRDAAE